MKKNINLNSYVHIFINQSREVLIFRIFKLIFSYFFNFVFVISIVFKIFFMRLKAKISGTFYSTTAILVIY